MFGWHVGMIDIADQRLHLKRGGDGGDAFSHGAQPDNAERFARQFKAAGRLVRKARFVLRRTHHFPKPARKSQNERESMFCDGGCAVLADIRRDHLRRPQRPQIEMIRRGRPRTDKFQSRMRLQKVPVDL